MNDTTVSPPRPQSGRVLRPQKTSDQTGWIRWLPGLHTLRHYDSAWLRHDVMAGLVLATMLVDPTQQQRTHC